MEGWKSQSAKFSGTIILALSLDQPILISPRAFIPWMQAGNRIEDTLVEAEVLKRLALSNKMMQWVRYLQLECRRIWLFQVGLDQMIGPRLINSLTRWWEKHRTRIRYLLHLSPIDPSSSQIIIKVRFLAQSTKIWVDALSATTKIWVKITSRW